MRCAASRAAAIAAPAVFLVRPMAVGYISRGRLTPPLRGVELDVEAVALAAADAGPAWGRAKPWTFVEELRIAQFFHGAEVRLARGLPAQTAANAHAHAKLIAARLPTSLRR